MPLLDLGPLPRLAGVDVMTNFQKFLSTTDDPLDVKFGELFAITRLNAGDMLASAGSGNAQIKANKNNANCTIRAQTAGAGYQNYIALDRSRGTLLAPEAIQVGDKFGSLIGVGAYDTSNSFGHGPEIVLYPISTWTPLNYGSEISMYAVANGSTTQTQCLVVAADANKSIVNFETQADIYKTAWTSWTPTITAAAGTAPQYSTSTCYYHQIGKIVFYTMFLNGDGGNEGSGGGIEFTTPTNIHSNDVITGCGGYINGATHAGLFGQVTGANKISPIKMSGGQLEGNDQNNTSRQIAFSGWYEAA